MTVKNLGPDVSGYLDPEDRNWELAVYQSGKPVLDKELNLSTDLATDQTRITSGRPLPSGWLTTDPTDLANTVSGLFQGTTTTPNELRLKGSLAAHVNGWRILVHHTNLQDYNILDMGSSPSGAGTTRTDLILLEVWRRLISPPPSTDGQSPAGRIWYKGNVKIPAAQDLTLNFENDLEDAVLASESTKRVQIQYRLRVIQGVDLGSYPYGMEDPVAVANSTPPDALTPDGVATTFTYSNQSASGDPGLWKAGDGIPTNNLNTVDGYMYAIPLCAVFRRNDAAFDRNSNHNGGLAYGGGSDRPDNYYYDIIESNDIYDLRLAVSPSGWNYPELLQKNLNRLFDNAIRTEFGSTLIGGGSRGTTYLTAVEVGVSNSNGGDGVTTGDTPGADFIGEFDGIRRTFSDEPILETTWLKYYPADFGYGSWPNTDFTINLTTATLQVHNHPVFNWAAYAPSNTTVIDVLDVWMEAEGSGNATSRPAVIIEGVGTIPQGNISLRFPSPGAISDQALMIRMLVSYPKGQGFPSYPVFDFGLSGLTFNNPGVVPSDFGADYGFGLDTSHRAFRYGYSTTVISRTDTISADSTGSGTTYINLYERPFSVTSLTLDAVPYAGTIYVDYENYYVYITGDVPVGTVAVIQYRAARPMQQVGHQITVWYRSAAPQTSRSDLIGTQLQVIPRYIDPSLYVLTGGPGSQGESYPFPQQAAQSGGVYPSSGGSYGGDYELQGGPDISLRDFEADTGFSKVHSNIPMVPDPNSLTLQRVPGDIDSEGRSYFKEVTSLYAPSSIGGPLTDPVPHRVVQPMVAELAEDSILGPKGMLVLLTIQRWAPEDKDNKVGFDSSLVTNTTSASVYRLQGNILNGRAS